MTSGLPPSPKANSFGDDHPSSDPDNPDPESLTRERLDRLARGVAHDLKNQLTAILGNLSLVLPRLPADSPQLPILREVELSAQQTVVLADQLQALAGRVGIDPTPTDLGVLAQEMVRLLRGALPLNAELVLQLAKEQVSTLADAARMREALMSLILNAGRAIEGRAEGGKVTLSTGHAPEAVGPLALDCRGPKLSAVFLEVTDNGVGMNEQTQRLAFDPYFTTKAGSKGLGLAYVAGVVRNHSGAISLRSAPDEGTTIRLYLPEL